MSSGLAFLQGGVTCVAISAQSVIYKRMNVHDVRSVVIYRTNEEVRFVINSGVGNQPTPSNLSRNPFVSNVRKFSRTDS